VAFSEHPNAVAADSVGDVYVADTGNSSTSFASAAFIRAALEDLGR
jgi:hypothetical protein